MTRWQEHSTTSSTRTDACLTLYFSKSPITLRRSRSIAVQAAKKALRLSRAGQGRELREFLRPRLDDLLKTHDHQESVSAFLDKRAPIYHGH